ncbi:hypothetical protein E2C01_022493 [Portunus trituberculatus]|uniref:Uncharacterized protein n=1 Tax=Portunus trituberculatus TaxID=210409 RepID=A0A5B7E772_PORTR|nr:hypothetical protein [Portunus trituberculatus]
MMVVVATDTRPKVCRILSPVPPSHSVNKPNVCVREASHLKGQADGGRQRIGENLGNLHNGCFRSLTTWRPPYLLGRPVSYGKYK